MNDLKLVSLECKRCGHKWIPRKAKVRWCPNCTSYKWDEVKGPNEAGRPRERGKVVSGSKV